MQSQQLSTAESQISSRGQSFAGLGGQVNMGHHVSQHPYVSCTTHLFAIIQPSPTLVQHLLKLQESTTLALLICIIGMCNLLNMHYIIKNMHRQSHVSSHITPYPTQVSLMAVQPAQECSAYNFSQPTASVAPYSPSLYPPPQPIQMGLQHGHVIGKDTFGNPAE